MKRRLIILLAVLSVAGVACVLKPNRSEDAKDEKWLASVLPLDISGFSMRKSDSNPLESYHMDEETYKKLKPYGIVARVFENPKSAIDTVVIAGDSPDNFHDPTWCLPGQGWKLQPRKTTVVHTQTRGDVPFSYLDATTDSGQKLLVAYTFKAPGGFHSSITRLTLDMWMKEFFSGKRQVGAFYRFLTLDQNTDLDKLSAFAAKYLDESNKTSHGTL